MNGPGQEANKASARREAARMTVQHTGPTADRYASALERYVQAVAADAPRAPAGAIRFPAHTVGDVMTRSVVTAYQKAPFKEIARALERNKINAVPVIDEQRRVVGVVTASDLLARVAETRPIPRGHRLTGRAETHRKLHAATAGELMTAPPVVTTPSTSIAEAARSAARARIRSLPVVAADGTLMGMVSRGDFLKLFLRSDADIRADIIRDVLQRPSERGRGQVRVKVEEGVATLSGRMESGLAARRVVVETGRVPGVLAVHDDIDFEINDVVFPRQT
jgi:CBS domain-containing protein